MSTQNSTDAATLEMWLDQDLGGTLAIDDRQRLDRCAAAGVATATLRQELQSLHALLAESRIEVRADFRQQLMARLPVATWEPRRSPAWALPLALALSLALAAGLLLARSDFTSGPSFGTALALVDFLQAASLAGAGLWAATWRGFGLGLEELMAASKLNLLAFGFGVLCLNLLFFRLLRRPALATAESSSARVSSSREQG